MYVFFIGKSIVLLCTLYVLWLSIKMTYNSINGLDVSDDYIIKIIIAVILIAIGVFIK